MRLTTAILSLAFLFGGCTSDKDEGTNKKLLDTGWFTDTADFDPETCPHRIQDWTPKGNEDDWYWRSAPTVWTGTRAEMFYGAELFDPGGYEVPVKLKWHATGNQFDVVFKSGLQPLGKYKMVLKDCSGKDKTVRFQVSSTGLPLTDGPGSLTGNTYEVHMREADWEEPPGLGSLLTLYFTVPIVLGVQLASPNALDLLGGVGYDAGSTLVQDFNEPTWDFPISDFQDHPFFSAQASQVNLRFQESQVPVSDFSISATFAPDGKTFSGGHISGVADTRHMGALFNEPNNASAVCDLAADFGVPCDKCSDGKKFCMDMTVKETRGTLVPGLKLVEND